VSSLSDWNEPRLTAWLVDRVADACFLDPEEVDVHRLVNDFGLSSRDAVGLSGELEQLLGIELPATLFWENPTIAGLVAKLIPNERPAPVQHRRRRASDGPIAVVGIGCRFPGLVDSPAAFWRLLADGLDGVGEVPSERWAGFRDRLGAQALDALPRHGGYLDDIAGFDAEFFGVAPREARLMDPQQRMVLEVAWEALEHAGIAPDSLRGSATGVYVGVSSVDYSQLTVTHLDAEAWSSTGASASISANRLSYALDLRGPSVTVDTACSSSLVAVHQACQALRLGEITTALVGGANALISPTSTASMAALGVLSPDGRCKAFDASADGITRAEGCGMLVLKRLVDAERDGDRVLAVIRASAVNSDGRSNGLTAPNPQAQEALLTAAYEAAGVDPAEIDYVEAHGTGTLLGDPIEAGALGAVLGAGRDPARPLLIGSVKSNLGHLEAAAGVAGLIKVVLAMRADVVPPSLHYDVPNPHIRFAESRLRVVREPSAWPRYGRVARAGVSAFGFGGTNAHVVLEEMPRVPVVAPAVGPSTEDPEPRPAVALVSATSDERLRAAAGHLAAWAASSDGADGSAAGGAAGGGLDVADVTYTLARRRRPGNQRAAVVAASMDELAEGLRRVAEGRPGPGAFTGTASRSPHQAVWLFSGYGSQWAGMGQGLLRANETFAAGVDDLADLFVEYAGVSLRKIVETEHMVRLEPTQLGIFGVQLALARLWRSYGLEPAGVIGNSMGEVAAAVVSGGLSTEDGVRVMALRARLLARLDDGAGGMASVQLSEAELDELLDPGLRGIEIAVHSAPDQLTVAGRPDEIQRLIERVEGRERLARLLPLSVACHTAAVEPMLAELAGGLTDLHPVVPSARFYNTVGDDPRETPVFDAAHWVAGARRPVRFAQAVSAAAGDGHTTFLELSPHPLMLGSVARTLAGQGLRATVVASMRNDEAESVTVSGALAALHCAGVEVDWTRAGRAGAIVSVPVVPWHHTRHWVEPVSTAPAALDPSRIVSLLGAPVDLSDGSAEGAADGWARRWEAEWSDALGVGAGRGALCEQLVLAAGQQALDADAVDVLELSMREPAAQPVTVSTLARANGEVEIRTRSKLGGWSVLATARVRAADRSAAVPDERAVPVAETVEVGDPTGTDLTTRVREIIASITGYLPDQVPTDVALADLGLDSLMAVRIRNVLAAEFASVPDLRDMQRGITVDAIVAELGTGRHGAGDGATGTDHTESAGPVRAGRPGAVVVPDAVEPRDAAERMMVRLWTAELGVSPESVTADFVALGGGRPQAVRLAERFFRELGHQFTADEVLARPILHEMASMVQPYVDGYDLSRPLRVLRHGDGCVDLPVHFFHPAGGPTSVYLPLVDRLPDSTPCYGLERECEDSVPVRVARHLQVVRAIQPEGPYRLAGWSFGGTLAFEAACQLQAAGAEVELLALIDTVRPQPTAGIDPRTFAAQRLSLLVRHIEQTYGKAVHLDHDELPVLDERRQIETVIAALGDAQLGMPDAVLRHQRTSVVDTHASERYEPGYFDGRVVLYRVLEVFQGIADLDPRYTRPDPEGGWTGHCRELEVVRVDGDHLSVIDPPHVDAVAADLSARLARSAVRSAVLDGQLDGQLNGHLNGRGR
jgi:polyketide synthase 13